ncbi:hypothetical protein [Brevundimonas sp. SORGH_AS_0993]|uniref:hypothetical protein n=1 Tax=Brevundimonas sp. SORGH_AS_0993 TaxID=3041794 RepID=UPI0027831A84|nr:hypothetical protein [Brevundimonas sp. SORGH_AS_0993]MDQ1154208.1 hypothetical protein [Brevundimonas sp. SORGH_AS_0993]
MVERTIRLNPRLDPRDFAAAYARDGMVQAPDLLDEASAEWLDLALEHDTAWRLSLKTPEGGFKPGFNVWTVFKTPRQHSVAPVAAYAGGKRRSITGWLRDDPPAR